MLDIDGRREFGYESVYFDTSDLRLYRDAATSRRIRFKVRTRLYRDADVAVLEVKAKDGRGQTIKSRLDYCVEDRHRLTPAAHEFVDELARCPGIAATLQPVLTTQYLRATFVDVTPGARYTVDRGLVCTEPCGHPIGLDEVIIETKSDGATSPIDRWLWKHGDSSGSHQQVLHCPGRDAPRTAGQQVAPNARTPLPLNPDAAASHLLKFRTRTPMTNRQSRSREAAWGVRRSTWTAGSVAAACSSSSQWPHSSSPS